MFLLCMGKSIFDSSSVVLLSFILFHLAVSGNEVTIPSTKRERIDEAINVIGEFLRSEKGIEWLAEAMKGRKSQLTTIDLVMAILETESLEGELWDAASVLKEALELKNDTINLEFNRPGAKSNSTEEIWNNTVSGIQDEDDILCLYRKNTNDPKMKKSDDWRKLLDIAPGYAIHSVSDKGSKYLICLKKINITETISTTSSSLAMTTIPNLTDHTSESESKDAIMSIDDINSRIFDSKVSGNNENSTKNLNKQTIQEVNRHDNENSTNNNDDDIEEDCSSEEQDETNMKDDNQNTPLKNMTPLYSGKSVNHVPGSPSKHNYRESIKAEKNLNDDELIYSSHEKGSQKIKKYHNKIRDTILKSRKAIIREEPETTMEPTTNEKLEPPRKLESQGQPNLHFQINTVQQAVPNQRMFAIPFIVYLGKLHAPENVQFKNNMCLSSWNKKNPPCINYRQHFLYPLLFRK